MDHVQEYLDDIKRLAGEIPPEKVTRIADLLIYAREKGRQVFIFGNGGSASTASHFACDLGKGTIKDHMNKNEKRFKVMSLADNIATITAYANDLSYEEIFSQQMQNFIAPDDIAIGISASGNSKNVVNAIRFANERGATTIGFAGFAGGELVRLAKESIHIRSDHYGKVEDMHMVLIHLISSLIKQKQA